MKLLIFVLNNNEKVDSLLSELSDQGLRGATILHSTGMAQSLYNRHESKLMNSLKALLDEEHDENTTIFTVVDQEQEQLFYRVVKQVVGELTEPNTGIIFTIPVDSVRGLVKRGGSER